MPNQTGSNPFIICPPDDLVQNNLDLKNMSQRLADKYANEEIVTDDDLRPIGSLLWQTLNIEKDFDIACRQVGTTILPVIIKSAAAEVQALPWETLVHSE